MVLVPVDQSRDPHHSQQLGEAQEVEEVVPLRVRQRCLHLGEREDADEVDEEPASKVRDDDLLVVEDPVVARRGSDLQEELQQDVHAEEDAGDDVEADDLIMWHAVAECHLHRDVGN
eukprot:CAMPEP_0195127472 /NCGR_PEP_ID=MMETSP0448-20130528/137076_1 /TAXON_ID=66468 /ORGANISM="Heterocapsa triquestra, Strain CCMP 448" /LENGTH=116 /DNA_ID=CAMNT_0040165223 /DNA_START=53 /DNA_END=400 /DNA_ORIENTATION=+